MLLYLEIVGKVSPVEYYSAFVINKILFHKRRVFVREMLN